MLLLAFLRQRTYCISVSLIAAFYLFVVARVGAVFQQFCEGRSSFAHVDQLQSEQILYT